MLAEDALGRLVSSASIFAQSESDIAKDTAQQIAVFCTISSTSAPIIDGATTVLAQLGNFPGLGEITRHGANTSSFQSALRNALLAEMNTIPIGGVRRALTNFQFEVWHSLSRKHSVAISAPTSAGKSFVVLEHLRMSAMSAAKFTAIYVAPTRALLSEIQETLERQLEAISDSIRVTTIPVSDPLNRQRQVYVLTQERLQLLLSTMSLTNEVDLIIVDEAQAIGDDGRGMILQDAIEKLRRANPSARALFLAPGVEGFEDLGAAVGIEDLSIRETGLSPVVQNRIIVNFDYADEKRLELELIAADGSNERIGFFNSSRGFGVSEDKRLAAVALELGQTGRSLVYATGAARAETLARQISNNSSDRQTDDAHAQAREKLAKFIEKDVHKSYSLAKFVRNGVAFHYGNMPSLLREGIEGAFREGHLDFLCCTTTLFQGVNLPARNVFIDTPTRGNKGEQLDEASLWNFAGRAGRLGRDVVGNVFLVDYHKWDTHPLSTRKRFAIKIAFQEAVNQDLEAIIDTLQSTADLRVPIEKHSARTASASGLILYRASQGDLAKLLSRPGLDLDPSQRERIEKIAKHALEALGLPTSVLAANWVVDPLSLARLLNRLRTKIAKGDFKNLIPVNPAFDGYEVYNAIIRRMFKHLGRMELSGPNAEGARRYANHVTATALKWMRGLPLSQLVGESVRYARNKSGEARKKPEEQVVDSAIRSMFELIEKVIRFTLVQWAKAYVDLLRLALEEAGHTARASEIYDFSLALELGVATDTGRALVELGLSRISAAAVASIILDSKLSTSEVKAWIQSHTLELESSLSGLVLGELVTKGLLIPTTIPEAPAVR
ncbi:DEAD/DEAH box helicase [Pseudoxanthomonas sp. Root630]|uniref:DEAD/DEAH box helicase n=1 Tax=Pseudoxanthomonas sp. Root630 TaxID=1736574 RepID=UPI0009D64C23|nr:DEAD/DEAH box helicase [Pseudoxanthomonas sp. Root630]